ncbi:hypothetical protein BJF80_09375 [Serinicoccus sp. CUA-874]|nr:hypothetical protein BJF80_09375 [Serinicoccus sp. CUA-874]
MAPGVHVRRHEELKLNCGLVVGEKRSLVVDTRSFHAQGQDLLESVRRITDTELVVVNTHAHYDHCFGNAAFRDSQIYAHSGAAEGLRRTGEHQRQQVVDHLRSTDREHLAEQVEDTEIVLPFYLIEDDTALDLGGRTVELQYAGRGHTDHDLAVGVPDAGVVFAGDLVEEGADPAMEDAFPMEWAPTLRSLLGRAPGRRRTPGCPGTATSWTAPSSRRRPSSSPPWPSVSPRCWAPGSPAWTRWPTRAAASVSARTRSGWPLSGRWSCGTDPRPGTGRSTVVAPAGPGAALTRIPAASFALGGPECSSWT